MKFRWLISGLLIAVPIVVSAAGPVRPAGAESSRATEVRRQAEQTLAIEAAGQKLRAEHHDQVSRLQDRIEDLERELKDISRRRQKTEAYLADQQAKVTELERRLAESKKIKQDLEPVLDRALERLELPGRNCPPDLAYGRGEIAALHRLLNNYDATLGQKTGRVLEVLKNQARLGHRVVVSDTELTIGQADWPVRLIRLGRLALFALSSDGRRAWRYDPAGQAFQPLDGAAARLAKLADIAQGRRLAELIKVPLIKPAAGEQDQ